jgi:putative tryptophan/tyrosine transport system substrate-binding protein
MKAVLLLIGFILANIHFAEAQHTIKLPRIGFISPLSASAASLNVEAFRSGIREFGYLDGKNIAVEYRLATGDANQNASLRE